MCRRAAGGPFAVLAWMPDDAIYWVGVPSFRRSSSIAQRGFCANCGTPTSLKYDGTNEIALFIGLFDQAEKLIPTYHYGIEGRLPWVDIGSGLPEKRTEEHID
jgi:hypothetical protein